MKKIPKIKFNSNVFKPIIKHKNEIMIFTGAIGMAVSGFMFGKETPKAIQLFNEKKKELNTDKLPAKETAKIILKTYSSPTLTLIASTSLILGGVTSNCKKNEALASMCAASNTALKQYQEKVVETIGSDKEKEISKKLAEETFEKKINGVPEDDLDYDDMDRIYWFEESCTGQRFKCTKRKIDNAGLEISKRMRDEQYCTVNEFLDELPGTRHSHLGEYSVWNIENGYCIPKMTRATWNEKGQTVWYIDYVVDPYYTTD